MDRRCCITFLLVFVFGMGTFVGCGDSGSNPGANTNAQTGDSTTADGQHATVAGPDTPDQAVFDFLKAVQLGNDQQAGQMLTQLAQQETAKRDMVVAPPGSDTASFEVGEVEKVGENEARVASSWTDVDHEGNSRTDHITWFLRRENNGWRIAGMATKIFEDQDPVVLNFENPDEMLEKQRVAEEEAMRRAEQENSQARKPEDPFQSPPQEGIPNATP